MFLRVYMFVSFFPLPLFYYYRTPTKKKLSTDGDRSLHHQGCFRRQCEQICPDIPIQRCVVQHICDLCFVLVTERVAQPIVVVHELVVDVHRRVKSPTHSHTTWINCEICCTSVSIVLLFSSYAPFLSAQFPPD